MVKEAPKEKKRNVKLVVLAIVVALVVLTISVMVVNSVKPDRIRLGHTEDQIKGSAFIRTNQLLVEQFYKNWLPNDLYWPTVFLDNMPNFQLGALEVVRYNVRVLRDSLSRMRTTDKLDKNAEGAFTALSNDPYKWWFPSAESKWKKAFNDLGTFYQNLQAGESHFYPRADNLVDLLEQYVSLMGGANTRLINAPRDMKVVLTMDDGNENRSEGPRMVDVDIPWYKIDDNFYYAQGVAYALYESFMAIRIDFIDVLEDKNSVQLMDKIVEDLGRCDFEPLVVFNGDLYSVFANHSMNLSGVFNDARQKANSLIVALKQG